MKVEYKNRRCKLDGTMGYFFGWQMKQEFQEVTKEEYEKSELPLLRISSK